MHGSGSVENARRQDRVKLLLPRRRTIPCIFMQGGLLERTDTLEPTNVAICRQ